MAQTEGDRHRAAQVERFAAHEAARTTTAASYTREFQMQTFRAGKENEFTTAVPAVGLVVAGNSSGYGSGAERSYIVLATGKSRAGMVTKATLAPIVRFDDKTVHYDVSRRLELVQSYSAAGQWKWAGEDLWAGSDAFYWGQIRPSSQGYER